MLRQNLHLVRVLKGRSLRDAFVPSVYARDAANDICFVWNGDIDLHAYQGSEGMALVEFLGLTSDVS